MNTLLNMLAMDDMAQKVGCGLNPKLREAIKAQLRFPCVSAGPVAQEIDPAAPLPENVTMLCQDSKRAGRKSA